MGVYFTNMGVCLLKREFVFENGSVLGQWEFDFVNRSLLFENGRFFLEIGVCFSRMGVCIATAIQQFFTGQKYL